MSRHKDNSNRLTVLIGILGTVFLILLSIIVTGLIKGDTRKPTDVRTLSFSLSRGRYNEIMQYVFMDKKWNVTQEPSKEYLKYQGVGEYYKYAIIFNAMDGNDDAQAEVSAKFMTEASDKMKDLSFAVDEMDDIIDNAIERVEKITSITVDGE